MLPSFVTGQEAVLGNEADVSVPGCCLFQKKVAVYFEGLLFFYCLILLNTGKYGLGCFDVFKSLTSVVEGE